MIQKLDCIWVKAFFGVIVIIDFYREVVIFMIFPFAFATTRTCRGMVLPAGLIPLPLYTSKKVSDPAIDFAPALRFMLGFFPATSGNWRDT